MAKVSAKDIIEEKITGLNYQGLATIAKAENLREELKRTEQTSQQIAGAVKALEAILGLMAGE